MSTRPQAATSHTRQVREARGRRSTREPSCHAIIGFADTLVGPLETTARALIAGPQQRPAEAAPGGQLMISE